MPAPMMGAPMNFTNPTGGNGLLMPPGSGLAMGIASGLNSAIDAFRNERQYQTQKQQMQKENQFKQNAYNLDMTKSGFQPGKPNADGSESYEYRPEKIAMDLAAREYEGLQSTQKAKQQANEKYLDSGADPNHLPFPEAYTPAALPDYRKFMPGHQQPETTPQGLLPVDQSQMQYPANAGGGYGLLSKDPSTQAPVQSVPTVATSSQPPPKPAAPDFSGLATSPKFKKAIAEADKEQSDATLAKNKVKDYVPEGAQKQADQISTTFTRNQNTLVTLQDAIKILNDPKQPLVAKAKAVEDATALMRDTEVPGRINEAQAEEANQLIRRIRTTPNDPGLGPDIKAQTGIFKNKMDLINNISKGQQNAYQKLSNGKRLAEIFQPEESEKKPAGDYSKLGAMKWLRDHPNDPKAERVRNALGLPSPQNANAGLLGH